MSNEDYKQAMDSINALLISMDPGDTTEILGHTVTYQDVEAARRLVFYQASGFTTYPPETEGVKAVIDRFLHHKQEITRHTILLLNDGSTCEVGDTRGWSEETKEKLIPEGALAEMREAGF